MRTKIGLTAIILWFVFQFFILPQDCPDTRESSENRAVGRICIRSGINLNPIGTCWIAPNGKLITASHVKGLDVNIQDLRVQFNVYETSHIALEENTYIVKTWLGSLYIPGQEGNDWAVFEVEPTSGLTPIQRQQAFLRVTQDVDLSSVSTIRVTGHGSDDAPLGFLQQSATGLKHNSSGTGKLAYYVYALFGNSGSPMIDEATGYAIGILSGGNCTNNGMLTQGTSVFNTQFWTALGLEKSVLVDQKREDNSRLTNTNIGRWKRYSNSFENNTLSIPNLPLEFTMVQGDDEVLKGDQNLVQNPDEKYIRWRVNNGDIQDVKNHHIFSITSDLANLTSQFKKTYTGITIKNNIEATGIDGGSVQFKDPWFIDYADPDYGNTLRNGGVDQATWRNRTSPFSPNSTTLYENGQKYNGVFLNQGYNPVNQTWTPPYYMVFSAQEMYLSQTGRTHKFYLQSWTYDPNKLTLRYPTLYETPIVFKTSDAILTANLKGTQLTNTSNTYNNTSQNKFLKTPNGYLHNVYESMGNVWYEQSTDGGTTWTIMNNGLPVNYNDGSSNAKSPAISSSNDSNDPFIYITYQADNVWGQSGAYVILTQYYHGLPRWPLTQFVSDILPSYSYDTRPVVTGLNQFAMVIYKSASNAPLTAVEFKVNVSGDISQIIPRSFPSAYVSGNSILPSITNSGGIYHLAYQDAVFTIRYLRWFVYTNPLTSKYYSIPSAGSGYIFNTEPSISCANFNPVISWKGTQYDNTRAAVLRRGTLSGSNMIWSDFLKVGSSVNFVHSNSANNSTEKTVMSWSQEGSFTKWVKRTYPVNGGTQYSAPANLSHTGINTQLTNGTDYNNMKANIFRSAAPLYYFTQSTTDFSVNQDEGGGELNKITVDDTLVTFGRSGVADINGVEFIFEIGDILAGDSIIKFIDKPDTIVYASSYELNEFTRTKSFTLTPATDFYFTNIYYVVPKSEPDTALTNTDAVNFKVELVNANTNQVVGAFDNVTYNKNNLEKYASIDYSVDCSGITPGDYYLRLVTNVNCNANYALANIISDNTTLAKKNFNKVNFTGGEIPINYDLAQNFPNPFNPSTTIRYQIPQDGIVTLKIYDILGSEVATLVNEEKVAGKYEVNFSASSLASGVYIYKIQSGSFVNSKKMILLK